MVLLTWTVGGCGGGATAAKVDSAVGLPEDAAQTISDGWGASSAIDLGADVSNVVQDAGNADEPDWVVVDGAALEVARPDRGNEVAATESDTPIAGPDAAAVRPGDGPAAIEGGVDTEKLPGPSVDAGTLECGSSGPDVPAVALDGNVLDGLGRGDGGGSAGDVGMRDLGLLDMGGIDAGPPQRIWVYIMAGQSNMLGQANSADLTSVDLQPVPNAEIYFDSPLETNSHLNAWLPVGPGFGWKDSQLGPELGFARRFHTLYPDRHLAIIKVCQGGTELYDLWKAPSGSLYQLLTKTVLEQLRVLSARGLPEIAGFLWMQGESDGTVLAHANAYQDNLAGLVRQLRLDLGVAMMPVVAGLIATDCCWTYADTIRKSTTQVSTMVGQMQVVETDDLPMGKLDLAHYSAAAQLELGTRFANTAVEVLGTSWKLSDGYSGVQGESYFTYRERAGGESKPLTFAAAETRWVGSTGASIQKSGMTPGASGQAELGWWAPFAGTFEISVWATVSDTQGAGTVVEVLDGPKGVWGPWSVGAGTSFVTSFSREMEQKDELFFRTSAGSGSNASNDMTSWRIEINTTSVSSGPQTLP